ASARGRVVAAAAWARAHGWGRPAVAARLTVSARSLRRWSRGAAPAARGRPVVRPAVAVREAVLAKLAEWGPRVGVGRLREAFPAVARGEVAGPRGRYRRGLRDPKRGGPGPPARVGAGRRGGGGLRSAAGGDRGPLPAALVGARPGQRRAVGLAAGDRRDRGGVVRRAGGAVPRARGAAGAQDRQRRRVPQRRAAESAIAVRGGGVILA